MISVPVLRRAVSADATSIAELLGELGYSIHPSFVGERLRLLGERDDDCIVVAEVAERVVGVVAVHLLPLFHADAWVGRITALVVGAHHRRHGVGRRLLDAGEAFAWERRCTHVEVTSGGTHEPAPHFYESNGYVDLDQHLMKGRP